MRTWKGFTLVELMITIAVASVLLGVGIPSLQQFLETNRRAAAVNLLVTSLQQARSTATARGARVVICQASSPAACDTAGTKDWSVGWLSFVDSDGDGVVDAGTDELLQYTQPQSNISMPANQYLFGYSPGLRGLSPATGGTIAVCPTDEDADGRWVVVSATGRPRLADSLPAPDAPGC